MASIKVTVKTGKLVAKVKRIVPAVEVELRARTLEAATTVMAQAVSAINGPKSGKVYTRRRRDKSFITWRASAPGEAPAKKTGENVSRIKVKKANRAMRPAARIAAPNIYKMLERGVAVGKGRQVLPRPLFKPLMDAYRQKFKDMLDDGVRRALGVTVRGG